MTRTRVLKDAAAAATAFAGSRTRAEAARKRRGTGAKDVGWQKLACDQEKEKEEEGESNPRIALTSCESLSQNSCLCFSCCRPHNSLPEKRIARSYPPV